MLNCRVLVLSVSVFALVMSAAAADVTGKWAARYETPGGMREATHDLNVEGDQLTGKVISDRGESEFTVTAGERTMEFVAKRVK